MKIIRAQMQHADVSGYDPRPTLLVRSYPLVLQCTFEVASTLKGLGIEMVETLTSSHYLGVAYHAVLKNEDELSAWLVLHAHSWQVAEIADGQQGFIDFEA